MKHLNHIFFTILFICTSIAWSDNQHPHGIIIDGTIGSKKITALQGPEYHILAEQGEIKGNNLFHSFQTFNVHNNEQAIFHGPDNIQHILSRVTGNDYSWIDGSIQTMIPDADLFLFNPNGVLFGPNTFLDVQGSFHVSTCEYIGFSDQSKYETTNNSPLLTSASPVSFGFVDHEFGQIHIQGKSQTTLPEYGLWPSLYVKNDHTLSLIAGHIVLKDGTVNTIQDFPVGTVVSENGRVNIVSVASTGEAVYLTDGIDVSSFEQMGDITLSNHSAISASSGEIYIYGNHLKLNTSYINAGQYSSDDNNVSGFAGGSIDIHVKQLSILDGSGIFIETFSAEDSGDINIHAESIFLKGNLDDANSSISTNSISLDLIDFYNRNNDSDISLSRVQKYGNAGNINIYTGNLYLSDGANIEANAFSHGNGGDISIMATDTVEIHGNLLDLCGILAMSISDIENNGHAGNIHIQAKNLILQDGGKIKSSTGGKADGGMINIDVDDSIIIKSVYQDIDIENPAYEKITGIFSISESMIEHPGKSGNAGNISLSGKSLFMENYSNLNVSSNSSGNAGKIHLDFDTIELDQYAAVFSISGSDGDSGHIFLYADKLVTLNQFSMIGAQSLGKGKPGGIIIDTPKITLENNSTVSATSLHHENTSDGLGVIIGRDIVLFEEEQDFEVHQICDEISILGHSEISTESHGKGQAGVIYLMSQSLLLDQSTVSSSSLKQGDSGHSGVITLVSEKILLDHQSIITTENAGMGDAGTINIFTKDLAMDNFSKIYSINTFEKDGGASGLIMVSSGIEPILPEEQIIIHPAKSISLNNHSGFSTSSLSKGGAGGIVVRAQNIVMSNSSFISAENKYHGFSDDIGIISIRGESIVLSSESKISTQSESETDAGGIALEISDLSMTGGSYISSAGIHPDRSGAGGYIFIAKRITHIDDVLFGFINIENKYELSDIFHIKEKVNTIRLDDFAYVSTSSAGAGDAGGIIISSQHVFLSDRARISSESSSTKGGGSAGLIQLLNVQHLSLIQDSKITTQAMNTSVPDTIIPGLIEQDRLNGMISIKASGDIHLLDSSISSSVLGGLGNGGNISIFSSDTILNKSQIIANAYEGNGGNIYITSDYVIQSSESIISASSQLGIDGNIVIEAFSENFDKQIISLPENFLNGSQWIQTPCQMRDDENISHFFITINKVCPKSFADWQPGRY
jgi:filamentous hemagglutinin family protein